MISSEHRMSRLSHCFHSARLAGAMVLAVLFLLTGCASSPKLDPGLSTRIQPKVLLEDVPFHPQRNYQCGPATLAMLLNDSNVDVSVDTLIPEVYVPGRKGSLQPEMLAATRRHGRIPFVLPARLDAILGEVDAGHPVAVLQNLSLPAFPLWHFAVVNGYDLSNEELSMRTGVTRQDHIAFSRFDATWARSNRWAFVALPPGEFPVDIEAQNALQTISDFESSQGAASALPAWQAFTERFPNNAMGAFALGNAYHATNDTEHAIDAWQQATLIDPMLAPAWLNLGLTQADLDQQSAARNALAQAATISGPWQETAQRALTELNAGGSDDRSTSQQDTGT